MSENWIICEKSPKSWQKTVFAENTSANNEKHNLRDFRVSVISVSLMIWYDYILSHSFVVVDDVHCCEYPSSFVSVSVWYLDLKQNPTITLCDKNPLCNSNIYTVI